MQRPPRCTPDTQEAVSPVIGTLLILAITVIGMAGILVWGAPTIEAVQAQNAQVGVVGEFEELRSSSIDLSIPDASRIPTVNVPRGTLAIEQGTRMMVTANNDASNTGCDFHVTDWAAAPVATASYTDTGCRGGATLEVLQVVGSNTVRKTITSAGGSFTVTDVGADLTQGNWLFRLSNGLDVGLVVYAQAWLFDSEQIVWDLPTSSGGVSAYFDLGAVFSSNGPAYFLEKAPSLQENEFGTGVYSLRLRTMSDAGGVTAVSGRGSHQVFLGLVGNHVRIDSPSVYRLRYDIQGDLAESWCGMFVQRNGDISGAAYAEDPAFACTQASDAAVRSVTFAKTPSAAFEVELIHANIRVSIAN